MIHRGSIGAVGSTMSAVPVSSGSTAPRWSPVLEIDAGRGRRSLRGLAQRLGVFVHALTAPLHNRLRRGEGGLLLVNASLALKGYPIGEAFGLAVISLICLLALYLFNDVVDARADQHNPKKDRFLADSYAHNRRTFLGVWLVTTGLAIGAAAWFDTRAAVAVVAVSLINVAYSLVCKRVPLLDVAWVGLWGAAYASIVTEAPAWMIAVGAMTSVCHIYQIVEDRVADTHTGIATSATLTTPVLSLLQAGLAGVLMVIAWTLTHGVAAATLVGLVVYWLTWRDRPRAGWLLAKGHFSVVWLYLLLRT